MHIFKINILIINFDAFYMFQIGGFMFRKMAACAVMVWYVLHASV